MKVLYLIRHAKSSWDDPLLEDIKRPLNKRGLRDAPFMATLLKGKGVLPDKIISSPAVRAHTTARYFAEAFEIPVDDIEVNPKIYEAYSEDVLEVVQFLPSDWNTVLLFGHNPTFTSLANLFSEDYISNVPTCGICKLQGEIESWEDFDTRNINLVEMYYPKQYFD